ncbi:MAG: alpha/beta fold hydrolase [Verrucomicrobiae bacterium]|nr:alpha/beta fold hydrolase [Verrucomicrobiae bacterium]
MSTGSKWRKWLIGDWNWRRPFKSVGAIYASLLVVAVFFADKLIFVPPSPSYDASAPRLKMIPLDSASSDGSIAAFWFPPPDDSAAVLLWTHGNAEDMGNLEPLLEIISGQGVGVMAFDYPGYGLSDGKPTEKGCYDAASAAFRFLTQELSIDPDRILFVGQSVGGGTAVWLAEQHPEARGLVLISPFLSAFRVVLPIPLFPGDRFPNLKRMPNVRIPLLLFHGENDEVISFSHGQKLFDLHPGPRKALVPLPDAGHNDLWSLEFETVLTKMMDFAILGKLPDS